jgi:hypothetical protein
MFRWVRRALVVIALVVVVGGLLLALTARPDLNRTQDDVEARWKTLRPALDQRYELLRAASDATRAAGGPERDITTSIDTALSDWRRSRTASVTGQVENANTLEALGRRLVTTVEASGRLQAQKAVVTPVNRLAGATVPASAEAFNRAVRDYEDARGGSLRRPVVGLMGYDSIPSYDAPVTTTEAQPT